MKFNTVMSVVAVALAVALTGCRYDKANGGAGADEAALAGGVTDEATDEVAFQDGPGGSDGQSGSLADIADGKRFEDMYARCNDVNFAPVYFGLDSTVVAGGELGKIDAVAQHLADNQNRVVVVEGHCDERGSNEYNMSLGEGRAVIVRNYLIQSGVGAERIQTRSYGEERPAVMGEGEEAWSKNRRGEFAIFQK